MRPRTICHPEALADWRANDEDTHNYLATVQEQINIGRTQDELDNNTLPEKQKKTDGLLARRVKEAFEREVRRCWALREEGET